MVKTTQNNDVVELDSAGLSATMLEMTPTPETIPLTLLTMQITIANLTRRVDQQDQIIATLIKQSEG